MKVGFVYDPIYLEHNTGQHPENANRLRAIMRYLERTGPWQQLVALTPTVAAVPAIALVHDREYIAQVRELAEKGGGQLDADTVMSVDSYKTARYAAGGAIKAVEAVKSLSNDIGIPEKLGQVGAKAEGIPQMAKDATESGIHFTTPRKIGLEGIESILKAAL